MGFKGAARLPPPLLQGGARPTSLLRRLLFVMHHLPHAPPSPPAGPLSEQNIKDRYYGVNDPVAEKLLARADKFSRPTPPEDRTICTLFVGGVTGALAEGWAAGAWAASAAGSGQGAAAACCCCTSAWLAFPRVAAAHTASSYSHLAPSAPPDDISEDDLRDQFYPYGELKSVKKVASRSCAFVTYATREAAERAVDELAAK